MPKPARLLLLSLTLASACLPGTPYAATPPDRNTVKSNLNITLQELDAVAKEQQKLKARHEEMDKELSALQKELVGIATTIQQRERTLIELEDSIAKLTHEEKTLSTGITRSKKEMDSLLMGMMKLSIVPPEMVLAMPGDFHNTLRTAKVLGLTSTVIQERAEALHTKLEEAQRLHARIERQREHVAAEQAALVTNRQSLEKKLSERGKIQDKLAIEQKSREKRVEKLSADSKSLRDLLDDLEARWQADAGKAAKLAMLPPSKPLPSAARSTAIRTTDTPAKAAPARSTGAALPAEGKIALAYGEKNEDGQESRGIRILTRDNAAVTAPFAGEVVYTGPFLDYGNLVILRHEGQYHSLLAGLGVIQCKTGQNVLRGEPVGRMGDDRKSAHLYVEIRRNNKPIDPIPWLEAEKLAAR